MIELSNDIGSQFKEKYINQKFTMSNKDKLILFLKKLKNTKQKLLN